MFPTRAWLLAALLGACPSCFSLDSTTDEIIPALAMGTGATVEDATDDALSRVVEKAVGTYLFHEMQVHDGVLEEELVAFRAAIIEDYAILTAIQDDNGAWNVRILAHVNTMPLSGRLRQTIQITEGDVNGASLVQNLLAKQKSWQTFVADAQVALKELLNGFPEDYILLTPLGDLAIADSGSEGFATVTLSYQLGVKESYSKAFASPMSRLLSDIGAKDQQSLNLEYQYDAGIESRYLLFPSGSQVNPSTPRFRHYYTKYEPVVSFCDGRAQEDLEGTCFVFIHNSKGTNGGFQPDFISMDSFRVSSDVIRPIRDSWNKPGQLSVRVSLFSSTGDLISQQSNPIGYDADTYLFSMPVLAGERTLTIRRRNSAGVGYVGWVKIPEGVSGALLSPVPLTLEGEQQRWDDTFLDDGSFNIRYPSAVDFRFTMPYSKLELVARVEAEVVRTR
jgi:hypothetical protein